ncbi:Crp/Fnr family transcriptional regulator [Candidatus Microgenomates bacterium]|nr:Crp/Fnr family transcriptional regulator [Candidatus Microgenomates bacterium]
MDEAISQKLEAFFTHYKEQKYKKGEILLRADEDPTGVYYLNNGSVKIYGISRKGDEIVLNIYKPISFFPMSWAMNGTVNKYYYEAVTDVVVWRAPREAVITFIKSNPDVLYDLMSRIYHGIDGILMRMNYLMAGSARMRLLNEIFIQAQRFGIVNKKNGSVELTMSEKDLAASSGMTRETVSREMKILKEKNLVTVGQNTILVRDIDRLEQEIMNDF